MKSSLKPIQKTLPKKGKEPESKKKTTVTGAKLSEPKLEAVAPKTKEMAKEEKQEWVEAPRLDPLASPQKGVQGTFPLEIPIPSDGSFQTNSRHAEIREMDRK
jgi:hypothetical protein